MAHMIEAKGLHKRFGDFTAVDGATFKINSGEVVGFLGPNGRAPLAANHSQFSLVAPARMPALQAR